MRIQTSIAVAVMLITSSVVASTNQGRTSRADSFKYKGKWVKDSVYTGNYEIQQGDTVQWGDFNGKPLYWRTKFWTQGEEPGTFGVQGGTNPWVLINSASFDPENGSTTYEWTGWNNQLDGTIKAGEAHVPTWRHGAEGAYTIIHDDIGALDWEDHVKPGLEINRKYDEIKVSWGCYVEKSDESEWAQMRTMVKEGHEMTCHSMNHTSAAEQWQWTNQDSLVSWKDLDIDPAIRGLKVQGFPMPDFESKSFTGSHTLENDLVKVTFEKGWGGGVKDPSSFDAGMEIKVEPKSGTETVTTPTGQVHYVKYTDNGEPDEEGRREGFIAAVHAGWYESKDAPDSWKENNGISWFMCKIWTKDKWGPSDFKVQIKDAKDKMDAEIYIPLEDSLGQYFPEGKRTEYFCYPFDAYSEVTHDSIEAYDYVTARGGAKSGIPLPGDFFHPYRLDFDAFYMVDPDHKTMFPDNPHSLMTLQGMVDSIVKQKGYMIRELHAVSRAPFEDINENSKGGWWGAITTDLYDRHLAYCVGLIKENKLVTYNASEVIKYRLTGNAVTGANMKKEGDKEYHLTVDADPIKDKYKDEISVIVKFDAGCDEIDVVYKNSAEAHPYRLPRKLSDDGTVWSVNVNPYKGVAILKPGTPWGGKVVSVVNKSSLTAVSGNAVLQGAVKGSITLSLPKSGTYQAALYSPMGRLLEKKVFHANAGVKKISLSKLSTGVSILRVIGSEKTLLNTKLVIE